ncbi:MAG: hypothetical protein IH820_10895 [Bacteroidetes bacterium]|nr:hypothetical protein [Bacteroidota bacterium]
MVPIRAVIVGDLIWHPKVLDGTRQPSPRGRRLAAVTVRSTGSAPLDVLDAQAGPLFDVVIEPGSVNFGAVAKGKRSSKKISVSYAGREDWRIKRLIIKNRHLKGTFKETNRYDGQVEYEFVITLDENAPVGIFRERILIETDDADSHYIPVLVKGTVEADVTVTV